MDLNATDGLDVNKVTDNKDNATEDSGADNKLYTKAELDKAIAKRDKAKADAKAKDDEIRRLNEQIENSKLSADELAAKQTKEIQVELDKARLKGEKLDKLMEKFRADNDKIEDDATKEVIEGMRDSGVDEITISKYVQKLSGKVVNNVNVESGTPINGTGIVALTKEEKAMAQKLKMSDAQWIEAKKRQGYI